jgi:hypothetical protein
MQDPNDIDDPPRSSDKRRHSGQTWPAPRRQLSSDDAGDFLDRVIHEVMSEPDDELPAEPEPADEDAGSEYVVPEGTGLDDAEPGAPAPEDLVPPMSEESFARAILKEEPKDEPSAPVRAYEDWDPPSTHSLVVHSVRQPPVAEEAHQNEKREQALDLPPLEPIVAELPADAPPSPPRRLAASPKSEPPPPIDDDEDEEEILEETPPVVERSSRRRAVAVTLEQEEPPRRSLTTHVLAFAVGVLGAIVVTQAVRENREPQPAAPPTAATAPAPTPSPTLAPASAVPTATAEPPPTPIATALPAEATAAPTATVEPGTGMTPWRPPPRATGSPYEEPPPPPAPPPKGGDPYEDKRPAPRPPPADDGFYSEG